MDYFLSSNSLGVYINDTPLADNSYIKINLNNNIIPVYDQFKQNKTGFLESKYSVNFVIGMNQIQFRHLEEQYGDNSEDGNVMVDVVEVETDNSKIILEDCIIFQSTNTVTVDGSPLQEIYQCYQKDIKFDFVDVRQVSQEERTVDNQSLAQQTEQFPTRLFYGNNLKQTDGDTVSINFNLKKTYHPVIINDIFKSNPNYRYNFKIYSPDRTLENHYTEFVPDRDNYIGILNTDDQREQYDIKRYNVMSIEDFQSPKSIRVLYQDTMETSPFGDKGYNGIYGNYAKELTQEFIKNNVVFFNFTTDPLKDKYGRFLQDQYYGEKRKENTLSYRLIANGLQTPMFSSSNEQYSQRYNHYMHEQMKDQIQNKRNIWNYVYDEQFFNDELYQDIDVMHEGTESTNDVGKVLWVQGVNPKDDYHEDYFYYDTYSMNVNATYYKEGLSYVQGKFYIFIPKFIKENYNYEYNIIRDKIISKQDGELKVYGEIRFSIENNFFYTIVYQSQQVV